MKLYSIFISSTEILFILFIVVIVFGADKIPDVAKGLGKGIRSLKNATNERILKSLRPFESAQRRSKEGQ